jgi:hypothetical protein
MKSALLVCALLAASALAQKPAPPASSPVTTTDTSAAQPAPTELEATQIENLELKRMLLQAEEATIPQRRQELDQQYDTLIRKIQAEHPGFFWNPNMHRLVQGPVAAKPAQKPIGDPSAEHTTPAKKDEAPKK